MSFALERSVAGTSSRVALAANPAYGFCPGVHVQEGNVEEFQVIERGLEPRNRG